MNTEIKCTCEDCSDWDSAVEERAKRDHDAYHGWQAFDRAHPKSVSPNEKLSYSKGGGEYI